jgi:hypothetical protein
MTNTDSNSQRAPRRVARSVAEPPSEERQDQQGGHQQGAIKALNGHQDQEPDNQTGAWMHDSFRPFVSRERLIALGEDARPDDRDDLLAHSVFQGG